MPIFLLAKYRRIANKGTWNKQQNFYNRQNTNDHSEWT